MKNLYAILCLAIASFTQLQAQAPQGFNYQATVRNSSGDLVVNTNVYFKFNVYKVHKQQCQFSQKRTMSPQTI